MTHPGGEKVLQLLRGLCNETHAHTHTHIYSMPLEDGYMRKDHGCNSNLKTFLVHIEMSHHRKLTLNNRSDLSSLLIQ